MTAPQRRVLVLEDEFFIADEIAHILESAGFEVLGPVATVSEALGHIAGALLFDAAVIDANLRGETSAPVAAALRAGKVPFVVCSGYRAEDLVPTFGPITLVTKPVHSGRLLSALRSSVTVGDR